MRILVAGQVAPSALDLLARENDLVLAVGADEATLTEAIADCDALVFRSGVEITGEVLRAARNLRLVIRAGSGYDNIDLAQLATMRVRVVRIPGPGAKAVAELAFAMMLSLARRVMWADAQWRSGRWVKAEATGRLLTGRDLGIVGAGNIGSRTGFLGSAWGMNVTGCVEFPTPAVREELDAVGIRLADFDTVISESDFVSVHVPLSHSTRNLIGADVLGKMRPGAILVNLSRGGVVDELALEEALIGGHLGGAGLDVHAVEGEGKVSPLAYLPNVILTPHIGAVATDAQEEIGRLIVECVRRGANPEDLQPGVPKNFVVI